MTEHKHTSGPWEVQLANSGARIVHGKEIIAFGLGQSRPNAHLIAAAPEPLEALREVSEVLDRWKLNEPVRETIRAAIAKATQGAK